MNERKKIQFFYHMKQAADNLEKEFKNVKNTVYDTSISCDLEGHDEDNCSVIDSHFCRLKEDYENIKFYLKKADKKADTAIDKLDKFHHLMNALSYAIEEEVEDLELHLKVYDYEPLPREESTDVTTVDNDFEENSAKKDSGTDVAEKSSGIEMVEKDSISNNAEKFFESNTKEKNTAGMSFESNTEERNATAKSFKSNTDEKNSAEKSFESNTGGKNVAETPEQTKKPEMKAMSSTPRFHDFISVEDYNNMKRMIQTSTARKQGTKKREKKELKFSGCLSEYKTDDSSSSSETDLVLTPSMDELPGKLRDIESKKKERHVYPDSPCPGGPILSTTTTRRLKFSSSDFAD